MKNGVIVVEGNIGAGKSTFSSLLAKNLNAFYEPEPDEKTNPYLEDYYENGARWAFNVQMFLLSKRWRAQRFAQQAVRHRGGFVVMDRSYYGDVCFANVQHKVGFFDDRDYMNYMSIHTDMKAELEPPALAIFLESSPKECKNRINKRMSEKEGRKCESSIKLSYLKNLHTEINKLEKEMQKLTWVIRVKWDEPRTPDQIEAIVWDVIEQIHKHKEMYPDFTTGINGIGA